MQPYLLALTLSLSPEELKGTVAQLKTAVKGIKADVAEIKVALGMPTAQCPCIGLPASIERKDKHVTTAGGLQVPEVFGAECATHDLATEPCSGEYKPTWCYEAWCYVDKACAAADTKSSFYFGKQAELHYSYQNCGGLDAFAAEACGAETEDAACTALSDSCAWNENAAACQNKLCQCTGDNGGMDTEKLGFEQGYGEKCAAWDQKSCEEYKDMGDGHQLGLWCCKSWCYVPAGCPSASPSAVAGAEALSYSYFACPDSADALAQCPWDEPINFDGSPVALSSAAAEALNEAEAQHGFLRRMRKHHHRAVRVEHA